MSARIASGRRGQALITAAKSGLFGPELGPSALIFAAVRAELPELLYCRACSDPVGVNYCRRHSRESNGTLLNVLAPRFDIGLAEIIAPTACGVEPARVGAITPCYLAADDWVMFGSYSIFFGSSPSWGNVSGSTRTAVETLNGNPLPVS
jgi:hypothetical protein